MVSSAKRVSNHAMLICLLLAACSPAAKAPTPEEAQALRPADVRLAGLYESSCKACHANPASGAPQVQNREQWDRRWKQGEAALLDHTIQGFGAMPALGQCVSCTPQDFKALIRFMADHEGR